MAAGAPAVWRESTAPEGAFWGYRRSDGPAGVRNHLVVIPSVICANTVAQRIAACIVNIGCDIAQQRIAAPADIDPAVELGLGYPRGPLRLGNDLGPPRMLAILEEMQRFYGDPRYRPSPWLKRRAMLGAALTTPEE